MGKRQVHLIPVSKPVTVAMLALVSAAMVWLLYFLSGKAYASSDNAFASLVLAVMRPERALSRSVVLASLMPFAANALLFVPWGFLAFVALDRRGRARRTTYTLAVAAGLFFALAVWAGQSVLPSRVTTLTDCIANAAGVLAGAALGHIRKDVRVRFDF